MTLSKHGCLPLAVAVFAAIPICCDSAPRDSTESKNSPKATQAIEDPNGAGTEQPLSVRRRLQRAIDVTRELEGKARHPTKEEMGHRQLRPLLACAYARGDIAPRGSGYAGERIPDVWSAAELRCSLRGEIVRYEQLRPWVARYSALWRRSSRGEGVPNWPGPTDAPQLRELLDDDPAVRCVAVEALATLHLPEDIPRIAQLLDDESDGLPVLGWNRDFCTVPTFSFGTPRPDDLNVMRSWHARKVKDYAWLALRLITGENLTSASFAPWWERNRNPRHRLWYWKRCLQDKINEAVVLPHLSYSPKMDRAAADRLATERAREIEIRKDAVRRKTAEELRGLPAEVEAKVRLLVKSWDWSNNDFSSTQPSFWAEIGPLRLSPERLLDLMDRKDLWEDIDWKYDKEGFDHYNRMVQRLMLAAPDIFGPEHTDRLRAVLAREKDTLHYSGRAAILIGISRLLPPAAPGNLDDPQTREGTLRAAIREGSHSAACELVRVGLPQNWPFLKEQFFARTKRPMRSMITTLGTPPLTDAKRTALRELVFEERFKRLWKTDRWCRASALRAVNAHAGEEIFPEPFPKELNDRTLPEILQEVADVLGQESGDTKIPRIRGIKGIKRN